MNIAYLSTDPGFSLDDVNGAAVHIREFTRTLAARNHRVRIYTVGGIAGAHAAGGIPVDVLDVSPTVRALRESLNAEPAFAQTHLAGELSRLVAAPDWRAALSARLCAQRPDLIYERYSLFGFSGVETARALGLPLILEVNAPLRYEQARYRRLDLPATAERLEREIFQQASGLVVVSSALARHARALGVGAERILVLPNGVDVERFHPAVDGAAERARYGLQDRFVVGFVGSLRTWHDMPTVLEALARLRRPDVHLLVVGDGPTREALQRRAQRLQLGERVTFTGAVPFERVPAHIAAMDAIVAPYAATCGEVGHYFSPLKVMEAMAMAKPIVAAAAGDLPGLLADGETGRLYAPGDSAQLAQALTELEADAAGRARLGAAARRRAEQAHSWQHAATRFESFAGDILKEHAGHALSRAA